MSITYFLNWMGPINEEWIERNGAQWSAGRIDIDGIPNEPFGDEISVPPMLTEDWNSLGDFLFSYESDRVLSLAEIEDEFEKATKLKIRWLLNEKL